ncbi:UDP-2,4-diacetamido-2,4,6-trideoxy-beta-L-altropyranose hydrolase [Spirosoma oryzicola]|uniref:UDP-2,4-diacetamido-2,4, 6-trideoxy-beta-L-altropyranose hydrolase n=1 Tax=Spirosoma oryzicola TaxID=2898794 RepID=UPI001E5DF097|nr:UDP-2,4-diacetamido-2,4,6-trideoxy-beta-L-altropyranose hydrolase [Spirosoma oryzicola]UHG92480.1 UDP-2,4-diacetamido-2,4,6-trideoxy-beta-L-altropyranose hydrolase [Spirosoma oryzicola]
MTDSCIAKLIFRVDGGPQIGLGHIIRCMAIADMIKSLFRISFLVQNPSASVKSLITESSFDIVDLPETSDYAVDANNLINHLTGQEFVILDGYSFGSDYQKLIKRHCHTLIAIDDLIAWHQYADVVINHGGNARMSDYQAESYTRFLLGTDYSLLRKPFLEAGMRTSFKTLSTFYPHKVLVNLGGADPENISKRVVNSLLKETVANQIVVVAGAANTHYDLAENEEENRVQVRRNLTSQEMVSAIQECDVSILSCSTISYEAATVGKPFIGILTADNQSFLSQFYADNQIALAVLKKDFTDAELNDSLSLPVSRINTSLFNQRRFFDGRSEERITKFFRELLVN